MIRGIRRRTWQGLVLLVIALLASSCGWRGISNVAIPGGPGGGSGSYTLYVQVPDTLAINGNSKVMVADVYVGSIKAINLKNWIATLTLGVSKSTKLPKNALAQNRPDFAAGFSARGAALPAAIRRPSNSRTATPSR